MGRFKYCYRVLYKYRCALPADKSGNYYYGRGKLKYGKSYILENDGRENCSRAKDVAPFHYLKQAYGFGLMSEPKERQPRLTNPTLVALATSSRQFGPG